jgi:transposase-like protein
MHPKPLCPFCSSRACAIEQRLNSLVEYFCSDCHRRWFAVEGANAVRNIPTFSPLSVRPFCPHCHQQTQVQIARTITRAAITEIYMCSLCGGALSRVGGKASA